MDATSTMEIKDNTFSRQFETIVDQGLVSVEYSFQEKKIFLTKINVPESFEDEEFVSNFLKNIMEIATDVSIPVFFLSPSVYCFNALFKLSRIPK